MKRCAAALLAALLVSCALPQPQPESALAQAPADFPDGYYREAAAHGEPVFSIDRSTSQMVIEVRRAGRLARLGHDHVVASHDVHGFIAPRGARADLYVPLALLSVDEPDLRRAAGFDTVISDEAIAGTRTNMLGPVLHAERNPFAVIAVRGLAQDRVVHVALTLNGVTRTRDVMADVAATDDDITVTGRLALLQTDFGITPLSIAGGAIQVQDEVDIRFVLHARRAGAGL